MTIRTLVLVLLICASFACAHSGLEPEVVQTFPQNVKLSYTRFEHKCARCHPLSRALGAQIFDRALWTTYVARMRHHAGSGISEADARTVLVFLEYYAELKKRNAQEAAAKKN